MQVPLGIQLWIFIFRKNLKKTFRIFRIISVNSLHLRIFPLKRPSKILTMINETKSHRRLVSLLSQSREQSGIFLDRKSKDSPNNIDRYLSSELNADFFFPGSAYDPYSKIKRGLQHSPLNYRRRKINSSVNVIMVNPSTIVQAEYETGLTKSRKIIKLPLIQFGSPTKGIDQVLINSPRINRTSQQTPVIKRSSPKQRTRPKKIKLSFAPKKLNTEPIRNFRQFQGWLDAEDQSLEQLVPKYFL